METLYGDLDRIGRELQEVVRTSTPDSVSGDQARRFVERFAAVERAAASGVALFTPVVVGTGSYAKEGHASAQDWLGEVSGSSAGAAKGRLAAAERAAVDPALTDALHEGGLSSAQLAVVTNAASEAPESTGDLLDLVEQGASHQELTDAAARLKAAARSRESERARRARVHTNRHLRAHQVETGGVRGEFFCDEVEWARIAPRIEARAKELWKAAGGGSEPLEAFRLDALIEQLSGADGPGGAGGTGDAGGPGDAGGRFDPGGSSSPSKGSRARARAIVVIDAAALRRGTSQGDEICEIEGIGPVSVEAATELLSEASVRFVIREGFDIKTVTKTTRDVAACIEAALIVRDRTCARPGCGKRLGLEVDHRCVDFGDDGPTELDNLVRLCPQCHDLKTYGGWRLEGKPGSWEWIAPAHPKSANYIARARKLAAAKGRDRGARQRNSPRRD
jgi:HNH endonuclease